MRPADRARAPVLRPRDHRRRSGRAGLRGLRRVRRAEGGAHRAERARRPGRHELDDRELSRLSQRRHRRRSGAPRRRRRPSASAPSCWSAIRSSASSAWTRTRSCSCRTARKWRATRCCCRRAWRFASWTCPGITPLIGAGVYYGAALSEAALYRGQHVFVLGGANSAGQGALFFARYAAQVTIIVRKPALLPAMSHYLVDRIKSTENITVRRRLGDRRRCTAPAISSGWTSATRRPARREASRANALFIFIGVAPRTEAFASLVATDEKGFILTGADVRAAGKRVGARPRPADVRDQRSRRLRRRRRARQRQPPHRRGRRRRLSRDLFGSPVFAERLSLTRGTRAGEKPPLSAEPGSPPRCAGRIRRRSDCLARP